MTKVQFILAAIFSLFIISESHWAQARTGRSSRSTPDKAEQVRKASQKDTKVVNATQRQSSKKTKVIHFIKSLGLATPQIINNKSLAVEIGKNSGVKTLYDRMVDGFSRVASELKEESNGELKKLKEQTVKEAVEVLELSYETVQQAGVKEAQASAQLLSMLTYHTANVISAKEKTPVENFQQFIRHVKTSLSQSTNSPQKALDTAAEKYVEKVLKISRNDSRFGKKVQEFKEELKKKCGLA